MDDLYKEVNILTEGRFTEYFIFPFRIRKKYKDMVRALETDIVQKDMGKTGDREVKLKICIDCFKSILKYQNKLIRILWVSFVMTVFTILYSIIILWQVPGVCFYDAIFWIGMILLSLSLVSYVVLVIKTIGDNSQGGLSFHHKKSPA